MAKGRRPLKIDQLTLDAAKAERKDFRHAFNQLHAVIENQDRMVAMLLDQIAELNLRVRYLMETTRLPVRKSALDSQPTMITVYEAYQVYGDRERFVKNLAKRDEEIQRLMAEFAERQKAEGAFHGEAAHPTPGASSQPTGEGPGNLRPDQGHDRSQAPTAGTDAAAPSISRFRTH